MCIRDRPTPEGLYQHYRAIADAARIPIIVYNVPGRTGVNVDPATLARLATIPGIIGVKEASGNMAQICEIRRAVPESFLVLSGDDALTLPVMAIGGNGIISVASNALPAEMVRLVEFADREDFASARRLHAALMPFMTVNFIEANPIPIKAAMTMLGLIEEHYRLPMVPPGEASRARIAATLSSVQAAVAGLSAPAGLR